MHEDGDSYRSSWVRKKDCLLAKTVIMSCTLKTAVDSRPTLQPRASATDGHAASLENLHLKSAFRRCTKAQRVGTGYDVANYGRDVREGMAGGGGIEGVMTCHFRACHPPL